MPSSSTHLVVFVHGLWGNPDHLAYLCKSLRAQYSEDEVHILAVKRNAGNFTYDGIERGGERAMEEIKEELKELATQGKAVDKISIIGYSLGGVVARYAIGLLYQAGFFEKHTPVNFTTFASPHLGVRTPRVGFGGKIWNTLGARTLSESGRQLFLQDKFRDTGRPLFAVLADPQSIFIRALKQFKHRSLYANCVNDRSAVYYTTAITSTDPYVDPAAIEVNYLEGWAPTIVDDSNPVSFKTPEQKAFSARLAESSQAIVNKVPLYLFLVFLLPFGATAFLANSLIQNVRSSRRIKDHDSGKTGYDFGLYKIPLLMAEAHEAVDEAYERAVNKQEQQYLSSGKDEESRGSESDSMGSDPKKQTPARPSFPTLALTQDQFAMIESLDKVGWKKHPVYIHNVNHSHAAIIVRSTFRNFDEGKVVVKHWLSEFEA